MTNEEVFDHLRALGFTSEASFAGSLERKLGPITLRASVSWMEQRVSIHGSYLDRDSMGDTEGMLSESVFRILMHPTGLLPANPSRQDITDRIDEVLSELPEPPAQRRLRMAIQNDQVEVVRTNLSTENVPPILKLGHNRGSMLHFAKSMEMVRLLRQVGVDPNQPDKAGRTPIFGATDLALIDALFAAGASTKHQDRDGKTVLHRPCSAKVVKRLLENGADPNARDGAGHVPLHHCLELPALVCLLSASAKVNAQDRQGRSPLMTHLEADRVPLAAVLLAHDADPEQRDEVGETAIFFARSTATMRLLLQDFDVDPHVRSHSGRSVLHRCQNAECVELLCASGLSPNLADADGCMPLHLSRTVGVVRALLRFGAAIDSQDRAGRTPLHQAAVRADHHVVFELLAHGAHPNLPDCDGNSALHLARTAAIARRIVLAGADPNQRNVAGELAGKFLDELSDSQ